MLTYNNKGFTLIEITLVILVIAILASIAILQYTSYQDKAKVTNFALAIVTACAKDAQADCVSRFVSTPTIIDLSSLANCSNITTAMGNVTVILQGTYTCNPNGMASGSIQGVLANIDRFTAVCDFSQNSIKCYVK